MPTTIIPFLLIQYVHIYKIYKRLSSKTQSQIPEKGTSTPSTLPYVRVPCESTADPKVQFLPSVHRQSLVLVGFSQPVHGITDVSVGDGTELGPVHSALVTVRLIHHRPDGVQNLNHTHKNKTKQKNPAIYAFAI